jgi:microcystin-dependent protein
MIIMWSGSIQEIPVGWHLCDGRKLTESQTKTTIVLPDLRGRMIRGGISAGLASGGSDWVTLTERELPSHTHQVTDNGHSHSSAFLIGNADGGGSDKAYSQNGGSGSGTVDTTSNTTGITIADKGQGLPFSILPAYYELAFLAFYPGYLP